MAKFLHKVSFLDKLLKHVRSMKGESFHSHWDLSLEVSYALDGRGVSYTNL